MALSGNPCLSTLRELWTEKRIRLDLRHYQTFHNTTVYLQWSLKNSSTVNQRSQCRPDCVFSSLPTLAATTPSKEKTNITHSCGSEMFLLSVNPERRRKLVNRNQNQDLCILTTVRPEVPEISGQPRRWDRIRLAQWEELNTSKRNSSVSHGDEDLLTDGCHSDGDWTTKTTVSRRVPALDPGRSQGFFQEGQLFLLDQGSEPGFPAPRSYTSVLNLLARSHIGGTGSSPKERRGGTLEGFLWTLKMQPQQCFGF